MIKETLLETSASKRAWWAKKDADQLNERYKPTYTAKQRAAAQTAVDLIDDVYSYKDIFVNFRSKFISIKVNKGIPKRVYDMRRMDDIFASKGYTKAVSQQGVTYRLPR